jgi:hypothetical protein
MIINTLQLTTRDQLFEDDMPLEPTEAEEMVTNWTHGAEKRCLQWKSALANFFAQGTQVSRLEMIPQRNNSCIGMSGTGGSGHNRTA